MVLKHIHNEYNNGTGNNARTILIYKNGDDEIEFYSNKCKTCAAVGGFGDDNSHTVFVAWKKSCGL